MGQYPRSSHLAHNSKAALSSQPSAKCAVAPSGAGPGRVQAGPR